MVDVWSIVRCCISSFPGIEKEQDGPEDDLLQDRQRGTGDQEQSWQACQGPRQGPDADRRQVHCRRAHRQVQVQRCRDGSLLQLSTGGYIKEFSNTSGSAPSTPLESSYVDDLDFTSSLAPGKNPYQSAQTE